MNALMNTDCEGWYVAFTTYARFFFFTRSNDRISNPFVHLQSLNNWQRGEASRRSGLLTEMRRLRNNVHALLRWCSILCHTLFYDGHHCSMMSTPLYPFIISLTTDSFLPGVRALTYSILLNILHYIYFSIHLNTSRFTLFLFNWNNLDILISQFRYNLLGTL